MPTYVRDATRRAEQMGSRALRELNVFDLSSTLRAGDVDVAFPVRVVSSLREGVAHLVAPSDPVFEPLTRLCEARAASAPEALLSVG